MIEVDLPDAEEVPELVRGFAACIASATETPLVVPLPRADLPGAMAHWRSWLAGRGVGLVPIVQLAGLLAGGDRRHRLGAGWR
jgi:hypothetical protein